jgi:hypothetical protein
MHNQMQARPPETRLLFRSSVNANGFDHDPRKCGADPQNLALKQIGSGPP